MLIIFTLFTTYYLVRSYFIKWQAVNNLILSMVQDHAHLRNTPRVFPMFYTGGLQGCGGGGGGGGGQILTKIRWTLGKVVCSLLKGVIAIKTIWYCMFLVSLIHITQSQIVSTVYYVTKRGCCDPPPGLPIEWSLTSCYQPASSPIT